MVCSGVLTVHTHPSTASSLESPLKLLTGAIGNCHIYQYFHMINFALKFPPRVFSWEGPKFIGC